MEAPKDASIVTARLLRISTSNQLKEQLRFKIDA